MGSVHITVNDRFSRQKFSVGKLNEDRGLLGGKGATVLPAACLNNNSCARRAGGQFLEAGM